ncbi:glycosyltransferase family 61 protein [Candidatus Dependentiae bacterium]|nr:glycosyltransferase family 61 protein [Candidatus Dependentiae bacterium]
MIKGAQILVIILSIFILKSFSCSNFKITPLQKILAQHPELIYQKVYHEIPFEIPPFPIIPSMPHKGIFKELFILHIPNGIMKSYDGHIIIDDGFIEELVWGDNNLRLIPQNTQEINPLNTIQIPGKVLVLSQIGSMNYCHWILEILGRLAIIEMNNIEYDWICVSDNKPFIKKIFELWGIDPAIVINPIDQNFTIQAETLIIPSLVTRTDLGHKHFGNFVHSNITLYTRNKLLNAANQYTIDTSHFSKRIFLSRKDGYNSRRILNEDEIFTALEPYGFKQYILNNLSLIEQIKLFNNAEIIIGEHGAGMANTLFCEPGCKIIELFHHFIPIDFWYISSLVGANYTSINTLNIDADFFKDCQQDGIRLGRAFNAQVTIPLNIIYEIIKTL